MMTPCRSSRKILGKTLALAGILAGTLALGGCAAPAYAPYPATYGYAGYGYYDYPGYAYGPTIGFYDGRGGHYRHGRARHGPWHAGWHGHRGSWHGHPGGHRPAVAHFSGHGRSHHS